MRAAAPGRWVAAATLALLVVALPGPATLAQAPSGSPGPDPDPSSDPATCAPEAEPNDRPEDAPSLSGEICVAGTLEEVPDQDLFFWEVAT